MRLVELSDLYNCNYSVDSVIAMRQTEDMMSCFNCIGRPKARHILVYMDGCRGVYTLKNGKKIVAESGDIVYSPVNSEYVVSFYDFLSPESSTIGVNFEIYNEQGEPFAFGSDVTVIKADNANYQSLFYKFANLSLSAPMCFGRHKAMMYRLLSELSDAVRGSYEEKFTIISKGIIYLEEEDDQQLTVKEIADLCNVSETYFRRLFKQYSGMSPNEFRLHNRIVRAKRYLQSDLAVSEIAYLVGFQDVSHFIKVFRERTGLTPLQYRYGGKIKKE